MYVKEFMQTKVVTVDKETSLADVQKLMTRRKIRRLPVVEGKDRLIAIITQDRITQTIKHPGVPLDTLQFMQALSKLKVKDVMVTQVITVTPNTTVEDAVAIGQLHQVGALPVVEGIEGNKLVGIVTTTDLYRLASQLLGFGQPGARLMVYGTMMRPIGEVTSVVASKKVEILSLLRITPPGTGRYVSVLHLDTDDASDIANELKAKGYGVEVRSSRAAARKGRTAERRVLGGEK